MKKITLEEHMTHPLNRAITEEYGKRNASTSFGYPGFHEPLKPKKIPEGLVNERLKDMDDHGIDIQVLSNEYPGVQGILDPREAVEKARIINDDMAELIKDYPTRFKLFATLPLQDPKAAVVEFKRAVKDLGCVGALINGHTNGEFLDEDKFRIVWECSIELGVPIYLHAFDPIPGEDKVYKGHRHLMGPTWSWNTDTATHVMRIISGGVFEELPEAKLIIGHMGEFLPYMLGRIDEGYMQTGGAKIWKIPKEPSYYYKKNVYITTSGLYHPETLVCAVSALTDGHILFSVDYPLADMAVSIAQVERTPISAEDKEKIFYKNAEKLLKL